MKKIKLMLVFSLVFLFVNSITAQDTVNRFPLILKEKRSNKKEIGLLIMPAFSSLEMKTYSGETVKEEESKGYGYGIMLGANFSNNIGAEMDVIYNSFSKKYRDKYLQREVNIKYINIPVLFSLSTNKSLPVSINMVLGPQVGFNAGSNTKTFVSSENDSLKGELSMKQVDIALAYGAGIRFSFSRLQSIHVGIGFRGTYGLTNISNTSKTLDPGAYYILDGTNFKTYSGFAALTIGF